MNNPPIVASRLPLVKGNLLVIASWFGLVAGLVEGAAVWFFQHLGWLPWDVSFVLPEIVWIATFFNLFLFCGLGLVLGLATRFFPRLRITTLAVCLFAFLALFDWISLPERLRSYSAFLLATGLAVTLTRWFTRRTEAVLSFWRLSLPWLAGVSVSIFVAIQVGLWLWERLAVAGLPAVRPPAANVLVIVVDTLRADHLSCYGWTRVTSPNLDRIAQEGIFFKNAFSTSSWTLPSHASLLTGRYPHEHGAEGLEPLDERYPTVAEVLRNRGYRTGAFSANTLIFCRNKGFGRGFLRFEDHFHSLGDMAACTFYGNKIEWHLLSRFGLGNVPARRRAADINRAALDWIDRDRQKPFFVFLNYFDTHDPYLPPQPFRNRFSKSKSPGGIINEYRERFYPKLTLDELKSEIDAYDGAITYVDEQIGRLLAELGRRGLAEKTLVVITSDHGESFGEHGLLTHRNALYREVIQVPLMIRWTGHLPAGVRVQWPVSNASLAATVIDLLGTEGVSPFPIPTLTPLWRLATPPSQWPYPQAELAMQVGPKLRRLRVPGFLGSIKALVTSRWHYIHHEKLGTELYEWRNDPSEAQNLVGTPAGRAVAEDLASQLQKHPPQLGLATSPTDSPLR